MQGNLLVRYKIFIFVGIFVGIFATSLVVFSDWLGKETANVIGGEFSIQVEETIVSGDAEDITEVEEESSEESLATTTEERPSTTTTASTPTTTTEEMIITEATSSIVVAVEDIQLSSPSSSTEPIEEISQATREEEREPFIEKNDDNWVPTTPSDCVKPESLTYFSNALQCMKSIF